MELATNLDAGSAIGLVVVLALGAMGIKGVPALWRDEVDYFHAVPPSWVWSDALWRGWVRALPSSGVIAIPLFLLAGVALAAADGSAMQAACGYATFGLLAVFLLNTAAISLFARPKFVIAPPLRSQPGAIGEWLHPGGRARADDETEPNRPRFLDSR